MMQYGRLLQRFLSSAKKQLMLLGICWMLLQAFLLWQFGIFTGLEAAKYIAQANLFLQTGNFESGNFIFYSTQILLLAASLKLKVGFGALVAIQILTNGVSVFLFYKLAYRLTHHPFLPLVATLAFLCMVYYHLYNVYLFTESLFFSFSILYAFVLFSSKKRFSHLAGIALFLLLLIFTRPTGILFLPPTVVYLVLQFGKKRAPLYLLLLGLTGLFLFYILLNQILASGGELNFLLPYIEEHVICGVPGVNPPHAIRMPVQQNSVEGLWYIISNHTDLFVRLAGQRFLAFWGVQRPYYSTGHNLFVAVYFYLVYLLIIFGFCRIGRSHPPQTAFMVTYILLVMVTVVLSCDEWHSRFLYAILPFLLLLATGLWSTKK